MIIRLRAVYYVLFRTYCIIILTAVYYVLFRTYCIYMYTYISVTCPATNVEPVSGICFLTDPTLELLTRAEAKQRCLDYGMKLAVIDTAEKQAFLEVSILNDPL